MKPILAAESIFKSFGRKQVLSSAGLWVVPGSVTVLVGRNGSGKSTLMRIAAGWLKPDSGTVIYNGRHLVRPSLASLSRLGLFFLPDRDLLSPSIRVGEHLGEVRRHNPEAEIEEAASLLEVDGLLEQKSKTLSSGERRRTELAVALARRPDCFVADEPFREIVPKDVALLARVLRRMADDGCAVVVSGQEARVLFEVADDVIWNTAGTTHHLGTPEEAMGHEQFHREYFGR